MKKLLLVTLMSSFFLVACGGDGGNSNAVTPPVTNEDGESDTNTTPDEDKTEEELLQDRLVKEYSLPPEPDVEENNATINGVDVNNNLIRDDWERAIVFEHHEDQLLMTLNQEYAKLNYQLNELYDSGNFEELRSSEPKIRELIGCVFYFGKDGLGSDNLDRMPVSTYERYVHQRQRDSEMLKGIGGVSGLNKSVLSDICPKYSK